MTTLQFIIAPAGNPLAAQFIRNDNQPREGETVVGMQTRIDSDALRSGGLCSPFHEVKPISDETLTGRQRP